jgi:hypothetical protein
MQPIRILLTAGIHKSEARNSKSETSSNARTPNAKEAKLLQRSWKQGEVVIPGKRSATRNPVPPKAAFKQFWIPAFAGMTE